MRRSDALTRVVGDAGGQSHRRNAPLFLLIGGANVLLSLAAFAVLTSFPWSPLGGSETIAYLSVTVVISLLAALLWDRGCVADEDRTSHNCFVPADVVGLGCHRRPYRRGLGRPDRLELVHPRRSADWADDGGELLGAGTPEASCRQARWACGVEVSKPPVHLRLLHRDSIATAPQAVC